MAGRPRSMRHPTSEHTDAPGRRSASASSTRRRRCGVTSELPPPMASWPALGPMTATLPTVAASSGNNPSLTSSTVPSAATRRATARRPGSSYSASAVAVGSPPRIPTRSMSRSTLRTWPSTTDSSTCPARTAAARDGPSQAEGPGISRSSPATAAGTVRVRPEPVGHHQPVEAPLAPQDPTDQIRLLAAVDAVDLVVGGHHGPDAGLAAPRARRRRGGSPAGCARRPRR